MNQNVLKAKEELVNFVYHVDGALVLGHLFPPLRVLVVIRQDGLLVGLVGFLVPGRDGLYSMFLSVLQAPIRQFACAVKAIADKQN